VNWILPAVKSMANCHDPGIVARRKRYRIERPQVVTVRMTLYAKSASATFLEPGSEPVWRRRPQPGGFEPGPSRYRDSETTLVGLGIQLEAQRPRSSVLSRGRRRHSIRWRDRRFRQQEPRLDRKGHNPHPERWRSRLTSFLARFSSSKGGRVKSTERRDP
jgi:hypothetical protein